MVLQRRYWPAGFTRTPSVRAILEPSEPAKLGGLANDGSIGQIVYFEGLTSADIKRLLELLPPEQADDGPSEGGPSFSEMVALGERYGTLRFSGYRVLPERPDERIVVTGIDVPQGLLDEILAGVDTPEDPSQRRYCDGQWWYRIWWD